MRVPRRHTVSSPQSVRFHNRRHARSSAPLSSEANTCCVNGTNAGGNGRNATPAEAFRSRLKNARVEWKESGRASASASTANRRRSCHVTFAVAATDRYRRVESAAPAVSTINSPEDTCSSIIRSRSSSSSNRQTHTHTHNAASARR